jgi:hypothetical protein
MMRVHTCGREQPPGMRIGKFCSIDIALVAAASNDHFVHASVGGPRQDVWQVIREAVVREIRTDIDQGVGHSYCNRLPIGGI